MNSDEQHQCFCRAVCGVCNGHIRHGVALNLAGWCRYFDALVREDVDGKRALTLPLDTVREQYACHPVEVSGESSVDNVVSPKTMVQATFRGRRLKGARMNLPKDYVGVVLKQGRVTHSDEQHKTWEPLVKFDKFTYWNLDQLPGKNDPIAQVICAPCRDLSARILILRCGSCQAMEWVDLARAVHTDSDSELPRRSPRKSPLKDYTNEGSPKKKRTKLDVTN